MKKLLMALMLALVMTLSMTACTWAIFEPPPQAEATEDHGETPDDGHGEDSNEDAAH